MNVGVKTSISTNRNIYDEKGNYLPSGNYYFLIKEFNSNIITGNITCRGEFGEFTFECSKVIKMMAIAQSRLARRANLQETGMPTYASPVNSPSHAFYNTNSIVQEYEPLPTVNYKSKELTLPTTRTKKKKKRLVIKELYTCVICLESIEKNKKNLVCFHSFHNSCINEWFQDGNINCPVCRKEQPFELIYDISNNIENTTSEHRETPNSETSRTDTTEMHSNRIIRVSNQIPRRVRINNYVSDTSSRTNNLERMAINNIRERYAFGSSSSHRYNLRPRSEI